MPSDVEVLRALAENGAASAWADATPAEIERALSAAISALEYRDAPEEPLQEIAIRAYYVLCEHFTEQHGTMAHDGRWTDETAHEVALEIDRYLFGPSALKERDSPRLRAECAEARVKELEEVLGPDLAGRPFADLLAETAMYLAEIGGGPVVECLRAKANAVLAALDLSPPPRVSEVPEHHDDTGSYGCYCANPETEGDR